MNAENVDVCQQAYVLSKSLALKVVLGVKCVLCICGMIACLAVMRRGGQWWLGSSLTRLIFIGHVFSALLCSSLFAFCYAYDVYRLSQVHSDPCDYTLNLPFAFTARIIPVFGMFGSIYFMVSLAIERSIATCAPASYGVASSSKCFAYIIVQIVIFLSLLVPLSFLVPTLNWSQRMYIFNTRTDENSEMFQIMIWLEIGPEVVAIAILHIALWVNHRGSPLMNTHYLDRRVQIESNKRVIRIVLPILWTHLAFTGLTTFGITLYPIIVSNPTVTSWYISMECVNVIQMYPCALAFILLYKLVLRPIQLPQRQISIILEQNRDEPTAVHFDQLQGMFSDGENYGRPPWFAGICC